MTRYYYGNVEFGKFGIESGGTTTPMAIIHELRDIKEFDDPQDAWEHWCVQGFDSYVSAEAIDENNQRYELVFKNKI